MKNIVAKLITYQKLLAVALLLFFVLQASWYLGTLNIWRDEAFSINVAEKTITEITQIASQDYQPPLHLYLLHYWMALFGSGEASARALSLVFATATCWVVYQIARQTWPEKPLLQLATLALITTHPYVLYYALEVRAYSMLMFGTALMVWAVSKSWSDQTLQWSRSSFLALATGALTVAYSHSLGVLIIAAVFIWQLITLLQKGYFWKNFSKEVQNYSLKVIATYALIGIIFLPWLLIMVKQLNHAQSEGFWLNFDKPAAILDGTINNFFLTDIFDNQRHSFSPLLNIFKNVGVSLLLLGLLSATQGSFLILWWLMVMVIFLFSYLTPVFYIRYVVFSIPVLTLALAQESQKLTKLISSRALALIFVLTILGNLYIFHNNIMTNPHVKADYQTALSYVQPLVQVNQLNQDQAITIIHPHAYTFHSFYYYAPRFDIHPGTVYDPQRKLPGYEATAALSENDYFNQDLQQYQKLVVPYLWKDEGFEAVLLENGFTLKEAQVFNGWITIEIWGQ